MKTLASLAVAICVALPVLGHAQSRLSEKDSQFLKQAAQSNLFEIQASQLALQSADQESVKQYARTMLSDHQKMGEALQRVARAHGVELPTGVEGKFKNTLARLQQERGPDFDKRYIEDVAIGGHEDAVNRVSGEIKDTQSDDVKAFAQASLSMLQQHLDRARHFTEPHKDDHADGTGSERAASPSAGAQQQPARENTLPAGQPKPQGKQPTMEGRPGTPENAAQAQ